jgi:nitrogen regulatory protein PII-like uncharacterized protein
LYEDFGFLIDYEGINPEKWAKTVAVPDDSPHDTHCAEV